MKRFAHDAPTIVGNILDSSHGPFLSITIFPNAHTKYFNFKIPIVNDRGQVLDTVLSELNKYANAKEINKLKIFNNDELLQTYSMSEFKHRGNQLTNLRIIIAQPPNHIDIADKQIQKELIKFFHDDPIYGGHVGKKRMYAKMKKAYAWKRMSKDIATFVNACHGCRLNKPKHGNIFF